MTSSAVLYFVRMCPTAAVAAPLTLEAGERHREAAHPAAPAAPAAAGAGGAGAGAGS